MAAHLDLAVPILVEALDHLLDLRLAQPEAEARDAVPELKGVDGSAT